MVIQRYSTRPLECLEKEREVRHTLRKRQEGMGEKGVVTVLSMGFPSPVVAGLGPFVRRLYAPFWSKAMRDPELLVKHHEVADAAGFPAGDICSSWHYYLGEILLGLTFKDPDTGKESRPDFILQSGFCPSMEKGTQLAGEITGLPTFITHMPQEGGGKAVEYLVAEYADAIDWMTGVTGKEFHDEWFIEAVENYWDHNVLRGRICYACQAVPAPLDYRMIRRLLRSVSIQFGHTKEVVEYLGAVLAEVEDRVRDGISAYGIETSRLTYENQAIFYQESFLDEIVRAYGAVFVAASPTYDASVWNKVPGVVGRWVPASTMKEMGVQLRDRQDALLFLAKCEMEHIPGSWMNRLNEKVNEYLYRALDWKCAASVIHLDIGCRNHALGSLEAKRLLDEHGVATFAFEASSTDPRYFSAKKVAEQFETFLEARLGLRRLPTEELGVV